MYSIIIQQEKQGVLLPAASTDAEAEKALPTAYDSLKLFCVLLHS